MAASKPLALLLFLCPVFLGNAQEIPAAPVSYSDLNSAFGADIWQDDNLWDDQDDSVGQRLKWPMESRTPSQAGFRFYPPDKYSILDTQAYACSMHSSNGHPTEISIVFTNQGDFHNAYQLGQQLDMARQQKDRKAEKKWQDTIDDALKELPSAIEKDASQIGQKLTELLGPPENDKFGKDKNTREKVLRWNWQGHAILLSSQDNSYVSIRIIPSDLADARGIVDKTSDGTLKASLSKQVEHRPNGDVILTGIPMVDQGPKGYCVPATWERYLRYLGIPADMYILARAGGTSFGGGTYINAMNSGVADMVSNYGRRLDTAKSSVDTKNISKYIDSGLPLMWGMFVDPQVDRQITSRSIQRTHASDWQAWEASLKEIRKDAKKMKVDPSAAGHMCMIIGYNSQTGEIATTDSWGPEFAERWMTVEEAEAVSQGSLTLVSW